MERTPKIMIGIHGKVQKLETTVYCFGFCVQKYEEFIVLASFLAILSAPNELSQAATKQCEFRHQ